MGLSLKIIIFLTLLLVAVLFLVIYLRREISNRDRGLIFLCLVVVLGGVYAAISDFYQKKDAIISFNREINFQGIVVDSYQRDNWQKLTVEIQAPYQGNVLINLPTHPLVKYGDLIDFNGFIKKPEDKGYADYLLKDNIYGVADRPAASLVGQRQKSIIRSFLFGIKDKVIAKFDAALNPKEAALLSGLMVGEQSGFSSQFREAMSKSGTTHLVALSGYNISIIVIGMFYIFGYFMGRRSTFILIILAIVGFVLMTGAEASVVRAATMGLIALLAYQVDRIYSVRNAIVLTAFLMTIINPRVLYFDTGFQLSFLALLGIVYLKPSIERFLYLRKEEGFLSWREIFLTTLSAQLIVAPLLILKFGTFSPLSLVANLLILTLVPLTMGLGFILAALGFIFSNLSLFFGWFVKLPLSYEIFIIEFFGKINVLSIGYLGVFLAVIYYLAVIGFVFYIRYFKAERVK